MAVPHEHVSFVDGVHAEQISRPSRWIIALQCRDSSKSSVVTVVVSVGLQELLGRRYYEVFYPHSDNSALNNAANNMWLTTCGAGKSTVGEEAPAGSRKLLLQRSDKNW
jgi:hypothetical protein